MPFAFNNAYIGEEELTFEQKMDRGKQDMVSNVIPLPHEHGVPPQPVVPSGFDWNDGFFTAVAFGLLLLACGVFYWTASFCEVNPNLTTNLHIQSGLEQMEIVEKHREQQELSQ